MHYSASLHRYDNMEYRRCGNSGLLLPALSLGLWHNFGDIDSQANARAILRLAFDKGITHFDLANNYGPPPGSAEANFGKIFKEDFLPYRDELIISTKAGWKMWEGPYGDYGSKKYLVASIDQSLKRMGLDYVDIFYHHRPDPHTPLEETMATLHLLVQQGKALYVGISSYPPAEAAKAFQLLQQMGTPCLIHQPRYSMLDRWVEDGLLDVLEKNGVGCIAFSPLAQGVLTNKYLKGIPADSRAASHRGNGAIEENVITPQLIHKLNALNEIADKRNQSLAQMALAWILKDKRITSVLIGVSKPEQLTDSLTALQHYSFSTEELQSIEAILHA
ncbi:MAG: L-glyceraldehyde 3-phosphate reductase [Sphingobacteriales bacterium]|uniref:L-glyceraldehyde 3-phosphate reductase n=1 Tax=Hydrotalea flava TaxID=714549 RepID=UPI00082EA73B|nr:L-glyceraldehyde 3-phosphate reductase [Hydrotalea flava]RTL49973.1 MAG: L-glyceraldehyde 3-phosphate reductase [Sphingobacteriales bacterium]